MTRLQISSITVAALVALTIPMLASADSITCTAPSYETRALSGPTNQGLPTTPLLRFVQLSDTHIYDDDGSPVFNGSELEPALEPTIANGSAQRLQDEYTDEVLNAMITTVNACNTNQSPIELMIATGDNTDTMTLNETRRYIDNLDGAKAGDSAYEANCGYTTVDSNQNPKLDGNAPCTDEMQAAFPIPTGKLVADSQSNPPDPESPLGQFMPVRSPMQNVDTTASSATGLSLTIAPGLPPALRCDAGAGCGNQKLEVPYYAVFGNHDGAVRGTVTMQRPFQAGTLAHGRYFFQSQREWINEFFYTTPAPGPVGHGFDLVDDGRFDDADDRNDGYYAFDAGNGAVRMIVLNTLYDGVRNELHRNGATNSDTQGLVQGNELTNPIGLEQGVLDQDQYDWLEGQLATAAAAGKPALVFAHHPDRSFTDQRLGFAADGGKTSVELDELLGRATFNANEDANTLVAYIAGHTHENLIRPCTPGDCDLGGESVTVGHSFWRIETASLIDYPQEGRIVELYEVGAGQWALKLTMISPDPNDATATLSKRLSEAEATCNVSQMLGGSLSSGPYDQARLETVIDNAGEAAVQGNFCFGAASLVMAKGTPAERDVILLP